MCEIFGVLPDNIFTENQINNILSTNKKEVEIKEAEILYYINNVSLIENKSDPEEFFISDKMGGNIKFILENYCTKRQAVILDMRMDGLSYFEIGKKFQVTSERIRQIEKKAL